MKAEKFVFYLLKTWLQSKCNKNTNKLSGDFDIDMTKNNKLVSSLMSTLRTFDLELFKVLKLTAICRNEFRDP